jgi:hypothetical protein
MIRGLLDDFRFGIRSLRNSPGFTTVSVLTLTLGIGVNVALFSALNDQFLRPRPILRPDEVWAIQAMLGLPALCSAARYLAFSKAADQPAMFAARCLFHFADLPRC